MAGVADLITDMRSRVDVGDEPYRAHPPGDTLTVNTQPAMRLLLRNLLPPQQDCHRKRPAPDATAYIPSVRDAPFSPNGLCPPMPSRCLLDILSDRRFGCGVRPAFASIPECFALVSSRLESSHC